MVLMVSPEVVEDLRIQSLVVVEVEDPDQVVVEVVGPDQVVVEDLVQVEQEVQLVLLVSLVYMVEVEEEDQLNVMIRWLKTLLEVDKYYFLKYQQQSLESWAHVQ